MKKITILALHLGYGGIERAISMLANNLVDDYEVNIVSTYKLYDKPIFELDSKIKVTYLIEDKPNRKEFKTNLKNLNIMGVIKEGLKAIKLLYLKKTRMVRYIKNCDSDVIITTRDIHNKWLGTYGKKEILKIGWEHNYHQNDKRYIKKVVSSVKELDYFILVSEELREFYSDQLKKEKVKCVYIPNAIDKISDRLSDLKSNNLISVGRISPEKGYLDLIEVFNLVSKNNDNLKLNIVGDGLQFDDVKKRINELKLNDKIIMHGFKNRDEVNKLLSESSLYLMCSYTESFGIVLLEAFAYGIPCIAFDSASGAKEVIENGKNGYLIESRNKQEMADKIMELMNNIELRKKFGEEGYRKVKSFDIKVVSKKWKELIK